MMGIYLVLGLYKQINVIQQDAKFNYQEQFFFHPISSSFKIALCTPLTFNKSKQKLST